MLKRLLITLSPCMLPAIAVAHIHLQPPIKLSESDFGGVGLWQLPTANMKPDGQVDVLVSYVWPYTRTNVILQPFPWLEGIIRYTSISNIPYRGPRMAKNEGDKDKSFDAKFRIIKEDYYWPAVAVGFRDFGGTGLFSSEYLNASKRFGNFDVTLGIAWGNMAGGIDGNIPNPLCSIANRFCHRNAVSKHGGTLTWGNYFSGSRASLFGGVEYQTPFSPLRLKLEYDPNNYQHEAAQFSKKALPHHSHWNFGAVYRLLHVFDLSVAYERGDTVMASLDFSASLKAAPTFLPKLDQQPIKLTTPKLPKHTTTSGRPTKYKVNWPVVVKYLLSVAGFKTVAIHQQGSHLIIKGKQLRYRNPYMAMQRISSVLYDATPLKYKTFTVVDQAYGMMFGQMTTSRSKIQQLDEQRLVPFNQNNEVHQVGDIDIHNHPALNHLSTPVWQSVPSKFNYYIEPGIKGLLAAPGKFYMYRLLLKVGGSYQIRRHLLLTGEFAYDIDDNMQGYTYNPPATPLPRVRTHVIEYLTTSKFWVNILQANYFKQLSRSWYGQVYGGYMEQMFGGLGTEVLYKPSGRFYAFSADVNYVKQRSFNEGFGFRHYGVTTAHLTWYYQWPIYHILSKISVGRYLAGDYGTTIDLSRQFSSGITIGAFATFTNVSAADYGEGSFTKGVYIRIPLDFFSLQSTTSQLNLSWMPLLRDGGATLNRKYSLYALATHEQ